MRGIVPAMLLDKLSDLIKEQGDERPLYSHFDLIAGTSTGGIIALMLGAPAQRTNLAVTEGALEPIYEQPKPQGKIREFFYGKQQPKVTGFIPAGIDTKQLPELYLKEGPNIFSKITGIPIVETAALMFTDKYDGRKFNQVLKRTFDDIPLSDAVVPTMVVTYDTKHAQSRILSSTDNNGILMREAARATSAAPTYFSALVHKDEQTGETWNLVDGGVIANNPVLYAYIEAKRLYPKAKRYHIISFSTASVPFIFDTQRSAGGAFGWMDISKGLPIYKIHSQAQSQLADTIAAGIPDLDYIRIDGQAGKEKIKMDDTSRWAMDMLQQAALEIFEQNKPILQGVAIQLSKRKVFDNIKTESVERLSIPSSV